MDYRHRLGLFGNSSTATESSDTKTMLGLCYSYTVRTSFFHTLCTSLHFHSFLACLFLCFFVIFQSYASHAQLSYLALMGSTLFWFGSAIKLNSIIIISKFTLDVYTNFDLV